MTTPIHTLVTSLLTPVLANSWAIELPPNPTWPAIVFEVATEPEEGWSAGVSYDRHDVQVVILARTLDEVLTLQPQVVAAFEACPQLMYEDASGDADYEADAEVYGRFVTFVLRTRR